MIRKICPECEKSSYSASERKDIPWICPHCGADINKCQEDRKQKVAG